MAVALREILADLSTMRLLDVSPEYFTCPTAGCDDIFCLDQPSTRQAVECPSCERTYCSACRQPYHYTVPCNELTDVTTRWLKWVIENRLPMEPSNSTASGGSNQPRAEEAKALLRRLEDLHADERWKEQHCRHCPHCGKLVNHVDGCDSMVCGRDADDKGGGNVQAG